MSRQKHPGNGNNFDWIHRLTEKAVKKKNKWIEQAGTCIKEHRKAVRITIAGIVTTTLIFTAGSAYYKSYDDSLTAYAVMLDGENIGIVRKAGDFEEAVLTLKKEINNRFGMEAYIPDKQEWLEVKANDDELNTKFELVTALKNQLEMKVLATALVVDGKELLVMADQREVNKLLNEIKSKYVSSEIDYVHIDFAEKVELRDVAADLPDIWKMDDAIQYLRTGTDEEKVHEVKPGETAWVIAERNGMTVADIEAANPGLNSSRLSIGDELNLIVPTPHLTVVTKEYAELEEAIPFDTEEVESDSMYKGDRRITVQGEEGWREVKVNIVRENGRRVERELIDEKRLEEPTTRVVAVGTKTRPPTMATGTFINPTRGRVSSNFGMRNGRRHLGIDVAAPIGTALKASDAGRVSFAGTSGAYGKLIIIDHENGYQTYYAHMNSFSVKAGTRVHKDQQIGTVGNTGRSTGPHVHFEIRKNGTPLNPRNFVKF
jgi:murein DD-endopeptidase MepM/ murein hydrolase activator NlpD